MPKKIVYVITRDPLKEAEHVSSVFAQALTALSFGYDCEIFLMGDAVVCAKTGGLDGVRSAAFEPLAEMLGNFVDMEGKIYVCHPASDARQIHVPDCIDTVQFVNASKLLESSTSADALFTF